MDKLTALFEQLSLHELSRVLRHTALGAIGVGVVALVASFALSHVLVGVGVVIGLVLGLINIRLVIRSVNKVSADSPAKPKRVLAQKSLYRLGMTTVVVVGLLIGSIQLGFGTLAGIAAFYFLLLVSLLRSILTSNTHGAIT
jgi:hypothetical protein